MLKAKSLGGIGVGVAVGVALAIATGQTSAVSEGIVSTAADGSTYGRVPGAALERANIDRSAVPEFILVEDDSGKEVGYVKRDIVMPPEGVAPPNGPVPVYGHDLRTVIGSMLPGVGFVPLGNRQPLEHIPFEEWADE